MVDLFTYIDDQFLIDKNSDHDNYFDNVKHSKNVQVTNEFKSDCENCCIKNKNNKSNINNDTIISDYELNLNNDFIHKLTYDEYEKQIKLLNKTINKSKKIFNSIVEVGEKKMRNIGFPTINVYYDNFIVSDGFYLSKLNIDEEEYYGLSLFNNYKKIAKIYILDFNKNIYGKKVTITVLNFIAQVYDENKISLYNQFMKNMFIVKKTK